MKWISLLTLMCLSGCRHPMTTEVEISSLSSKIAIRCQYGPVLTPVSHKPALEPLEY